MKDGWLSCTVLSCLSRVRAGLLWGLAGLVLTAQAEGTGPARGVNPKDNISKVEVIYKNDDLGASGRIQGLAFKFDQALDAQWGFNLELPYANAKVPGLRASGMGDLQARLRYVANQGSMAYIMGAEVVLPTAASPKALLGRDAWQLNPSIGVVWSLNPAVFWYVGYKHLWSVSGADLNQSQPRTLLAYTSPQGWWVLGDLKLTLDHDAPPDSDRLLDMEVEFGRMINRDTAFSIRLGTSAMDSNRDLGLSLSLRRMF